MFLLKELPDKKSIKKIAKDNKAIDATSAHFTLQFIRTASDALITIDKFFSAKGLSHGRFIALSVLSEAPDEGIFPYELADSMGVSRATASGLIKGLEATGLIVSIQSKTDGRMKRIALTDEGKTLIEELTPEYYAFISKFTGSIEKKSLKQFIGVLTQLGDVVSSID